MSDKRFPFKLPPQQAQEIIDIACTEWKNRLFTMWGRHIVLKQSFEVSEHFYREMRKACTHDQHEVLDRIFGKDEPEWEPKSGDWVYWDGVNPGVFQVIRKSDNLKWGECYVLDEDTYNSCHISNLRPATLEEIKAKFDAVGYAVPIKSEPGTLADTHERTIGKVYKIAGHKNVPIINEPHFQLCKEDGSVDGNGYIPYSWCRPATAEEVKSVTRFTAKKGDWIVITDFGKMQYRKGYTLNKPYQLINDFYADEALQDDYGNKRAIKFYEAGYGVKFRFATEEEIRLATFPPDGTPCLSKSDIEGWILRFSAGNGNFYVNGKKSGHTHFWNEWIDLTKTPLDKLPVVE